MILQVCDTTSLATYLIRAVLREGESSLGRNGSQECHTAVLTYKVCCAVVRWEGEEGGRRRSGGGGGGGGGRKKEKKMIEDGGGGRK